MSTVETTKVRDCVVVPWDFSKQSKAALKFARKRFADSRIRVLCVLEPPNPYAMDFQWNADSETEVARICSEDFGKQSGIRGTKAVSFECRFGDPADEIVRYANIHQAAYIVMSTRGKTGLKKILLGSVAQDVLRRASCPVIVLTGLWCELNEQEESDADAWPATVH